MTFGNPLPPWTLAAVLAAALFVAWLAYRGVPIAPPRRRTLSALRFLTLLWLVICLMRPMGRATDVLARDAIVPILVDTSRSMALADTGGARRIDRARALVERELLPSLAPHFHTEVLRFGDRVSPAEASNLTATDRRTSLGAALQAVRDRYRGRALAGIVLVTDGGDNGGVDAAASAAAAAPEYAIGIGPRSSPRGRQVVSVTPPQPPLIHPLHYPARPLR